MASFLPPSPIFSFTPSSPPADRPRSHRQLHVQNVLSLLHLSILRQDYPRARRAWSLLARTREVPWEALYRYEAALTTKEELTDWDDGRARQEWLEDLRREGTREMIPLLQAKVVHLLSLSPPRPSDALDLIEIYITSIPYATSAALHGLAAMCALGKGLERAGQAGATPLRPDIATATKYIQAALALLPAARSEEDDDGADPDEMDETGGARAFYLSLAKLAEEMPRWGDAQAQDSSDEDDEQEEETKANRVESSSEEEEDRTGKVEEDGQRDESVDMDTT